MRVNSTSTNFKPRQDAILVSVQPIGEETINEIIVSLGPNSVLDRPTSGKVVSVGSDVKNIIVNDEVFWDIADGIDMEFDDGHFMLIKEQRILCMRER